MGRVIVLQVLLYTLVFGGQISEQFFFNDETSMRNVCDTMTPVHPDGNNGTIKPQDVEPPYRVTVSKLFIKQGTNITVKLDAEGDNHIRGYFIQARTVEDYNKIFGKWSNLPEKSMTTDCQGVKDSVVHNLTEIKQLPLYFTWTAPTDFSGRLLLWASIAKEYTHFWLGLTSNVLEITV